MAIPSDQNLFYSLEFFASSQTIWLFSVGRFASQTLNTSLRLHECKSFARRRKKVCVCAALHPCLLCVCLLDVRRQEEVFATGRQLSVILFVTRAHDQRFSWGARFFQTLCAAWLYIRGGRLATFCPFLNEIICQMHARGCCTHPQQKVMRLWLIICSFLYFLRKCEPRDDNGIARSKETPRDAINTMN